MPLAPHTVFGVPTTFSGELYDASRSPEDFYRSAVSTGFHSKLLEKGYSVNLIPQLPMKSAPHTHYFQVPSTYRGTHEQLVRANAKRIMDTTLFRISPHFLRMQIYDNGNWLFSKPNPSQNEATSFLIKALFKDYIDGLTPTQDAPAYHFLHLLPPHPPYVTLANGSYAGEVLPNTRENFKNETRPLIGLLVHMIKRLKTLGIYDSSTLLIQGDHGSGISPVIKRETIRPCVPRLPALLAIKPPNSTGPLKVSNAQTSLLDVAPTVLSIAGENTRSVFHIDPTAELIRPYFKQQGNQIIQYSLQGSVYDRASCKKQGSRQIVVDRPLYTMGVKTDFGVESNATGLLDYGWGSQIQGYSWSRQKKAGLLIRIDEQNQHRALILDLWSRAYLHAEKLPTQRVRLSINDTLVDEWVVQDSLLQHRRISIPGSATGEDELKLTFEFPDAASERSLGLGAGYQKLGIALHSLQLDIQAATP